MNMLVRTAAAAAVVPAIAQAAPKDSAPDPIFAAIDRHKQAVEAFAAVQREVHRLSELADETVGTSYISVLNMRDSDNGCCLYVDAYTTHDISDLVPGLENQELRLFYLNKLAKRRREREAIEGDTDAILEEPLMRLRDTEHAMRQTAPTTVPGLLALLTHIGKTATADPYFLDDEDRAFFLVALGESAEQLGGQIA